MSEIADGDVIERKVCLQTATLIANCPNANGEFWWLGYEMTRSAHLL